MERESIHYKVSGRDRHPPPASLRAPALLALAILVTMGGTLAAWVWAKQTARQTGRVEGLDAVLREQQGDYRKLQELESEQSRRVEHLEAVLREQQGDYRKLQELESEQSRRVEHLEAALREQQDDYLRLALGPLGDRADLEAALREQQDDYRKLQSLASAQASRLEKLEAALCKHQNDYRALQDRVAGLLRPEKPGGTPPKPGTDVPTDRRQAVPHN